MTEYDETDRPEIPDSELRQRVVYALLKSVVGLAKRFSFPLKDFLDLAEMAYFHELKKDGGTLEEIAESLDISRRKAVDLSNRLKRNFLENAEDTELGWRIEFMLWVGAMTEGRIAQSLSGAEREDVEDVLDELVEQGRVVRDDGNPPSYRIPDEELRLYRDNWMAKINGLENLATNLGNTVFGRFFGDVAASFARTVTFRIREQDIETLETFYRETFWPRLKSLDEEGAKAEDDEVQNLDLSILWAPAKLLDNADDS
jgi:hypothetical protein